MGGNKQAECGAELLPSMRHMGSPAHGSSWCSQACGKLSTDVTSSQWMTCSTALLTRDLLLPKLWRCLKSIRSTTQPFIAMREKEVTTESC